MKEQFGFIAPSEAPARLSASPSSLIPTVKTLLPPTAYPQVGTLEGSGVSPGAAAVLGAVGGLAVGAGAMLLKQMGSAKQDGSDTPNKEG